MKCSEGCAAKGEFPHPEWPQDTDQRLCRDCRISALEQQAEDMEADLEDVRAQIADLEGITND